MVNKLGHKNKGTNINYNFSEAQMIEQEVYDLLSNHKKMNKALDPVALKGKLHPHKNGMEELAQFTEIQLDGMILDDPSLYNGIQKIYRNHGVDIPSQQVIDKNEVISAKKKRIREALYK